MGKEPGQRTREAFEVCFIGYAKMIMHPGAWGCLSSQQKAAWAQMEAAIEAPHLAEVERFKAKVAELEADRIPLVERCVDAMMVGVLCDKHKAEWIKLFERVGPKAISEILAQCDGCVREERDRLRTKAAELEGCPSDDDICTAFDALHRAKGWQREEPGTLAFFADGAKWAWKAALKAHHASSAQELPHDLPAPGRDRDAPRRPTVDRMDAAPACDEHLDRPEERPGHVCEVGGCPECDKAARERNERAKPYQCTPCLTWQGRDYRGLCLGCGGSKEEHEWRA